MVQCLHDTLTMGCKVKLRGEGFPEEFQDGDILELLNLEPEDGNFVLLRCGGKHKIEKFVSDHMDPENMLGIVNSFQRSVGEFDLFLGEDCDKEVVPALCVGCDQIEAIETAGSVGAYCWAKHGVERVPMGLKRCICGSRRAWQGER